MHKKFETNRTKIKGGCHSGRKEVTHNSKSDLPLAQLRAQFSSGRGKPRLEKNEDEPTNQPTYLVHHVILQEGKQ